MQWGEHGKHSKLSLVDSCLRIRKRLGRLGCGISRILHHFTSNIIEFHFFVEDLSQLNQGLRGVELGWCYVHRCFPALPALPRNACDSPWDGCRQGVEVPAVLLIVVYCRIYEMIVE